jgi:hypothetical protein
MGSQQVAETPMGMHVRDDDERNAVRDVFTTTV